MKVFISYTRKSNQHDQRVAQLAKRIISELAFECDLDQFHANQNWPAWMEERIEWADRVLVIATPTYHRRWTGQESSGIGLGAKWESLLTRQHLYELEGKNDKFVPVIFAKGHAKYIPTPLRGYSRVLVDVAGSLEALRCRLLGIAPVSKPVHAPLAATKLDENYLPGFPAMSIGKPVRRGREADEFDPSNIGLSSSSEQLIANLFPISYPATVYRAKPTRRTGRKSLWESLSTHWRKSGGRDLPAQDFLFEGNVVYRFEDFLDQPWVSMLQHHRLRRLDPLPVAELAESEVFGTKSIFIKLLTRCLTELCRSHDMTFSRELKCHLFFATRARSRSVTVQSLSKSGTRVLCKAIPDRKSAKADAILHWQHQAFRHRFVRFGKDWFISITPFWAFTSDGFRQKSRFQKSWSSKLRKPERNRAVLGHLLMWSSILSRGPDMLRHYDNLRIAPPDRLIVSPSIIDKEWLRLARDEEKIVLQHDLTTPLSDEVGPSIP